ncbi:MAG TPA: hypothetical protein VMV89_07015 [Candidatus Paceibacterota bacterium]|nr:hypothetical protein [Candidatus Paceibacterota bacterium]
MTSQEQGFQDFAAFAAKLKGDEKSEAQTFFFHLLEAFMLARRLATRSAHEFWDAYADVLPGGDTHALQFEKDLPLDNLAANIVCADALFKPWPEADAIIGKPADFVSKDCVGVPS